MLHDKQSTAQLDMLNGEPDVQVGQFERDESPVGERKRKTHPWKLGGKIEREDESKSGRQRFKAR